MAVTPLTATTYSGLTASATLATGDILAADVSGNTRKITAGNFRNQIFGFAAADALNIGPLTATTGSFSGAVAMTALTATTGTFSGAVSMLGLTATTGAFSNSASIGAGGLSIPGGNIVVGGAFVDATVAIEVFGTTLSGTQPIGVASFCTMPATATVSGTAIFARLITTASAFTMTSGYGLSVQSPTIGAGSAVTTLYGIKVENQTTGGTNYSIYTGSGDVSLGDRLVLRTAVSKIVAGATSISLRNNADSADNILITDAGNVTIRANLIMATAVGKIVPGATSLDFRNNADTQSNLLISDAGTVQVSNGKLTLSAATTARPSILMPSGTAPTSPADGDFWYDGTNLKFRNGGTSRTITWV